MLNYRAMAAGAAFLLTGCSTLVAPEEVAALKLATGDLTIALTAADSEQHSAYSEARRERQRINIAYGLAPAFVTDCAATTSAIYKGFLDTIDLPYSSVAGDQSFRKLRSVAPCGISDLVPALDVLPDATPVRLGSDRVAQIGRSSLPRAARQLDAYVAALSDIATNETGGKVDAAREQLVASGKGLLGALKVGGPADAFLILVDSAIGSLIAAKRNKATREFLNEMDEAIPFMMERLGTGARIAVLEAAWNRAEASKSLAMFGNYRLVEPGMVAKQGRRQWGTPLRMSTYDELMLRLDVHNGKFLGLRKSDPMIAARDFAAAHRALRDLFNDPAANRAAVAVGLADFRESAAALVAALNPST